MLSASCLYFLQRHDLLVVICVFRQITVFYRLYLIVLNGNTSLILTRATSKILTLQFTNFEFILTNKFSVLATAK